MGHLDGMEMTILQLGAWSEPMAIPCSQLGVGFGQTLVCLSSLHQVGWLQEV